MDELSISEYLNMKGITIIGQYFDYDKNIQKREIAPQINLIIELHKKLIGCSFNGLSRIKSTIGKEVESYKIQVKKLQRNYDYIINKSLTNDIEKLILSNGKIMLRKAEKAISYIYEHDYYGVIKRSMNREEICIGKVDKNNLRRINEKIQIGTIKGMTYNLVEEDLYSYIKRLQRKEFNIDEDEMIELFIRGSHLSFNSFDYLRGLCSYPKDFLKAWEKYELGRREEADNIYVSPSNYNLVYKNKKEKKLEKSSEEILLELNRSLKYESRSLII